MEKQRYNLKDVAKLAGVSLGTASKVINNQYVRPEARLKVEEAMQELDYTPNAIARSLKANSTKTIGIMIPDISSPVVGKVLRGIEKIGRGSGYSILLYNTTRNTRLEEDAIQAFMRSQVDGIIYLGNTVGDEIAEGLKRTHVPVVFAKKTQTKNIAGEVYTTKVESFTHGRVYDIIVSKEFLGPDDKVLLIDDFLANGKALEGLVALVKDSGAKLVGAGIVVEKGFQVGGDLLRSEGIRLESLAIVESMDEDTQTIVFRDDE